MRDCDGDCDDNDEDVFPGQTDFFSEPRANESFDFDCNDDVEKLITTVVPECFRVAASSCSSVEGWATNAPPACGEEGTYRICSRFKGTCRQTEETRTQTCR